MKMTMRNRRVGIVASEKMDLALKIAKETSIRQASARTGISRKLIKKTMDQIPTEGEIKRDTRNMIRLRADNPLVKQAVKEAVSLGVEKASENLKDRILKLIGDLYDTAEEALKKTRVIIEFAGTNNPLDDMKVQQLKLLTAVWGTAVSSASILSGGKAANNKGDEGGTNIYNVDARQIILSRIDRITTAKGEGSCQQDDNQGT